MQRSWRRTTILSSVAALATAFIAIAPAAQADTPTSSVEVSPTTVLPGQTFTVTQTIHNDRDFTVTFAKGAIYGTPTAITDVVDVVSCTNTTAVGCFQAGSSYRAAFGDLEAGGTKTTVWTLRVKDTAAPGSFTLQHQFVGDNYSFETFDGPVITIGNPVTNADIKVALGATGHGGLNARIDYTLTVTNNGPSAATGIRVVATYPAGLSFASGNGCVRVGTTRTVNCDVASLASGASATPKFSVNGGLLALGSYTTTAARTASSPADPNPANDSASKTCSALTGLIVSC
ncbi:conserved repeat domain-containing protein [Amycolatopsis tolypomycina]|uniref:Conserved repeat domain-containing protein n=1 Tax=Amycolatopsis tolypomycina TaxID=208445 RepID=A0A1H4IFK3_9PSEU|nr:conserved repeat domain-containing protein [Amycolatopsis tolypomycina]